MINPHLPINSTARRVVAPSFDHGQDFKIGVKIYSMAPLPTRQFPGRIKDDLTGKKSGRYTVIGCATFVPNNYLTSRQNTVRWVVRCTCGRYGILTTKGVKKNHPNTMCDVCKKFA